VFADQFETLANTRAHYHGTAAELWQQAGGAVDAFVAGSGTGGTLAGVSRYLKERDPSVRIYLVDPPGSSLHNKARDFAAITNFPIQSGDLKYKGIRGGAR
jgi:cysteine synthase A